MSKFWKKEILRQSDRNGCNRKDEETEKFQEKIESTELNLYPVIPICRKCQKMLKTVPMRCLL